MAQPGRPPRRGREPSPKDFALPLPQQTAVRIPKEPNAKENDNVGLWLDKLVPLERDGWALKDKFRDHSLKPFCKKHESPVGAQAQLRQEEMVAAFHGGHGGLHRSLRAQCDGRLLIDYGGANTIETALSFHRIWGVPRVAGSALKGVVRTLLTDEGADPRRVIRLLGDDATKDQQGQAGQVTFYDALPLGGKFELGLDVLTPHYPDYYGKKGPPGEWQDPVPHTFLTVVKTEFVFHLGLSFLPQEERALTIEQRQDELVWLYDALKRALTRYGIGAKTSAGYGRFKATT